MQMLTGNFVILFLLIFSIIILSCSTTALTPDHKKTISYSKMSNPIYINNVKINYGISVPTSYSSQNPTPLVLALHYGGNITADYGETFLNSFAEPALIELNAIIISPTCPINNGWDNADCEDLMMALIDSVKSTYNIDESRTIVMGFSLGAIGTWYLSVMQDNFFKAAIPVAGMPTANILAGIKDVPTYVIHSTGDDVFPIDEVESMVRELQNQGKAIKFKKILEVPHYSTSAYIKHVAGAISWVEQIWAGQ